MYIFQHEKKGGEVGTAQLHGQLEEYKTKVCQFEEDLRLSQETQAKLSHALHQCKLEASQLEAQKVELTGQLERAQQEKSEMKSAEDRLTAAVQKLAQEKQDLVAMNSELMAKSSVDGDDVYIVVPKEEEGHQQQSKIPAHPMSLLSMTRHDQAVSDLLIQLQEERTKVSKLQASNNQRQIKVCTWDIG